MTEDEDEADLFIVMASAGLEQRIDLIANRLDLRHVSLRPNALFKQPSTHSNKSQFVELLPAPKEFMIRVLATHRESVVDAVLEYQRPVVKYTVSDTMRLAVASRLGEHWVKKVLETKLQLLQNLIMTVRQV